MPKKTKKEKIIAQYHRKLHQFHENVSVSTEQMSPLQTAQHKPSLSPFVYQATTRTEKTAVAEAQPMDLAIRTGLIKTVLLAIIAIGAEVGLSVYLNK